jgi:dynein intermediate chain 1
VGTEEGGVALYSKAYVGQLQESFDGHHLSVYSLRWNPFHPRVFLSCSADWTIKLWEVGSPKPIMSFDLSNPVGDVAWAPYSSTVFAAITSDGRLRVFDLNVNKHEPIGESRVVKKAKLTRLSFNPKEPVVLVGDDAGAVMSLKLSPNLRKMAAPSIDDLDRKNEVDKLERLLVYGDRDPKLARARGAR